MSVAIRDTDRGLAARLAALREAARWEVVVGVLADDKGLAPHAEPDGAKGAPLTVLDLATIHEFGAPDAHVPQRSFVRATVDARAGEIRALQRSLGAQVFAGKLAMRDALDQLGAQVAGWIQARIATGIDPPNAASTVARKGSATPLIGESGQLRGSVTWQVREKAA